MSRFLLFANIVLAASLALFANHWRIEKAEAKRRVETLVRLDAIPLQKPRTPAADRGGVANPAALGAAAVQQFVFSGDRSPNVVEKATAQAAPMPPLPAVYGTLSLGESPRILLGFNPQSQHVYQAGESVGPFRLVRFDSDTATFEWNGREITRSVQELASQREAEISREPMASILASMPAPSHDFKQAADSSHMGRRSVQPNMRASKETSNPPEA